MIDSRMITFFSLLALLCLAFLVVVVPVSIYSLARGGVPESLRPIRDALGQTALWMAFAVAAVTTFGSLWLSEAENLPPCVLCWYQRIAMYPLAVILAIAAIRDDAAVARYAIPLAAIGAAISAWHIGVQRLPGLPSGSCSLDVPCSSIYVEVLGFITIPTMALAGFLGVITLLLLRGGDHTDLELTS